MEISLDSLVHRRQDHLASEVDGEYVVLCLERGRYFGFNDVGRAIWCRLATPITVAALCADIAQEFDGDPKLIEADVLRLLNTLHVEEMVFAAP